MNRLLLLFALVLPASVFSQTVFWTENFNNSCSANCSAVGYNGGNGAWTQTVTGVEGADPNMWYVSCAENGYVPGNCGSGCVPASAIATLATLHVGSNPNSLGDLGAAYDAGGLCGLWTCPQTDRRIESPVINCSGRTNITLAFNYIKFGAPPNDDATVWYYDGSTWSQLTNPAQTLINCAGGQGRWTAFSFALPASANNNANVKIGFRWVNNDDGVGTDPSFAVDDITLSVPSASAPVAAFTASATSVCVGQPVNFTDNSTGSPTSWSWTFPSGTPATSSSQNVTGVTWATAGTYTVTLTATNVNGSSNATQVITVNPTPTVTASASSTTICAGQQTTLTCSGASTYVWNPGNLSGSSVVVSPGSTTTYTVTGTSAAGCTATAQVTITVNSCPGPIAAFTASNDTICIGGSVNFTDNTTNNPTSWSWTFPGGTPGSSTSQNVSGVVWNTAGTYTVTLTASNSNGNSSATQIIFVSPSPVITASASPATICTGQQSTLTASGASTYVWNPGNLTGASVTVSPASTTTYTVTGTNAAGCTGTAQVTVTVQPCLVPVANFTGSDTMICVGDCINFTDLSTNSPTSWSWTFSGSSTASSNSQNPANICYPTAGTYAVTLIATNANGSGSLTKTGYIIVNPAPVANAGPDASICVGQSTSLLGSGGVTYSWNPGNLSGSPVSVTPASTTTYTLTVTDANGCTGTDQVTITVTPCTAPVAALNASQTTICQSTCIDFTDMSTGSPTGWSWTFAGGTPVTSTQQNPSNICYNQPGVYPVTLIVTNAFGSDTIVMSSYVSVGAQPSVDAGPYVTIAIGNSTQLNATGGTGSWSWTPAGGLNNSSIPNPTASPTVTTTYTVTFTDSYGCTDSDTVTVEVIEHYSLYIPSAFSPNGDGANDVLYVRGAGIRNLEFVVFDRWGEKVFESSSINDGWDGTYKGKEVNTGIYVWFVNVDYFDGKSEFKKGDVSLVR